MKDDAAMTAECKACGAALKYKIVTRPWNGQKEIVVEPCEECAGRAYNSGFEDGEKD